MQKSTKYFSLEFFKKAQDVLSDGSIDKISDIIRLDCANIADVKYKVPTNIIQNANTYPLLEQKTFEAFYNKLESFGVDLKSVDVGVTHSIFEFLKDAFLKISLHELKKNKRAVKILLPKEQFGYFHSIIENSGAEAVLVDTNKDGKVNLDDLKDKLTTTKKEGSCVGFMFLNPVNPTQVVYSQNEVDAISYVLEGGNLDFAFEDMTFMDVHKDRFNEVLLDEEARKQWIAQRPVYDKSGKIRGRTMSFSDIELFNDRNPPGTLSKTPISNRTMLLYSVAKSYTASARISSFAVPHGLFKELKLNNTNIDSYEYPYESQWRVQGAVLGVEPEQKYIFNQNRVPIEAIKHYKTIHQFYVDGCHAINVCLSKKFGLSPHFPYEFISVKPKEWQSTNVANLDFSGFKNFLIDGRKLTNGIDVFNFLVDKTHTKTIPCEANFIKGIQVRVSLGEKEEKINEFFGRLSQCLEKSDIQKDTQLINFTSEFTKDKLDITNMSMLGSEGNVSMIRRVKNEVQREKLSGQRSKSQPQTSTDFSTTL